MKITRKKLNHLIHNVLFEYKDASDQYRSTSFLFINKRIKPDERKNNFLNASRLADSKPGTTVAIGNKKSPDSYGGIICTDKNDKKYQYKLFDLDENDIKVYIVRSPKDPNISYEKPEEIDFKKDKKKYEAIVGLFSSEDK